MQSLFLGTSSNRDVLATLCSLCTEGRTPALTNSAEFEVTVRGFLSHSINSTETDRSVRVGAFRVEMVDGLDGCEGSQLTDIKDVPVMCGAAAALIKYIQCMPAACNILATVRRLNAWMGGAGQAYGVQRLIQAGRTLAATSGTNGLATDMVHNLLNAAKVVVLQHPLGPQPELSILMEAALDCMANNPPAWVRQAFVARQKLRARFKAYLDIQGRILSQQGPALLASFPIQCVEVIVDPGLLTELECLRAGETVNVQHATMATQNPSGIDIVFGDQWVANSLEEHRERPSLLLIGSKDRDLGAACVQLATTGVMQMCTALSPWMLLSGLWNLRLQDQSTWAFARLVVEELRSYNARVFSASNRNPFDFYPNDHQHPYGYSFTDTVLQVPSTKAALMAPLFCSVDQKKTHPEFLVRCFLPLVIATKRDWSKICQTVADRATVHQFACSPAELVQTLAGSGAVFSRMPPPILQVDLEHLDLEDIVADLQADLDQPPAGWTGIASPYPASYAAMVAMFHFVTGGTYQQFPVHLLAAAVVRYAFLRFVHGDGTVFTQKAFDAVLADRGFVALSTTGVMQCTAPPKMTPWLKTQMTHYVRLAPLPMGLDTLLAVANHLELAEEVQMVLTKTCRGDIHTRFTGVQATTLLKASRTPEERRAIWKNLDHHSLSPTLIQSWDAAWQTEFLHCVDHTILPRVPQYLQCVQRCLDGLRAACPESTLFLSSLCQTQPETVVDLLAGLEQRVVFATPALGQLFQDVARSAIDHPRHSDLLDRCLSVPGFCHLHEMYAHALSCAEDVVPTARQLEMASGIRIWCPDMLESPVIGPLLQQSYAKIVVGADVRLLAHQWIKHITANCGSFTHHTVYTYMTRQHATSVVSGHAWIRGQLEQGPAGLLALIRLRKLVAQGRYAHIGRRMCLHTSALEILYTCLEQNTTLVPDMYMPIH
jgi:hypothetical protein